ncbi:hypothetical protein [Anaerotignum sp.]
MATLLLIIAFVVYMKYMDYRKDNAIDHYDINKINPARLTKDMDKPLRVREQNLLAGKYDYQKGDIDAVTGKRH